MFFSLSSNRLLKGLRMASKKPPQAPDEATPLDVIFSCSVCGDTLTDVYEGHSETVLGLSDGFNTKDRLVTRLYVASCCHVICIKHIEGGRGESAMIILSAYVANRSRSGPAFHKEHQHPQAPCPVCVNEGAGDTPRQLFSVRGFKENEHDPAIPPLWFKAPPMKLDAKDKEMEALRVG